MALGWLWDGFGVALGGLSAGASRKSENSVIMRIAEGDSLAGNHNRFGVGNRGF